MNELTPFKNEERELLEALSYLIIEKGMSYFDLFGEEWEGHVTKDGKIRLYKRGIPLPALKELVKAHQKFLKEQARRLKKTNK